MRYLSRVSLGTRLTIVGAAMLLPLAVLVVFSYLDDRESTREAQVASATAYGQNLANSLDSFARDLEGFMAAAALIVSSNPGPISQETHGPFLRSLATRYEVLNGLFITDTQGRVLAQSEGSDAGLDLSQRPYIKALQDGATSVWTGGIDGLDQGLLTIAYSRVIRDMEGEPAAYLVASFQPGKVVDAVPPDLPKDANIAIIDKDGRIFVSLADLGMQHTPRDLSDDPDVQAALDGSLVQFESRSTALDDGERFGAYVPVPTMDWVIAYSRPQSVLDAAGESRLTRNLGIIAGMVLVSIAAVAVISRQMTRPLRRLAEAAADITAGRRVDVPVYNSDPDVAKLQQAFAQMSSAVAEREDRLREQTRLLRMLDQVGAWIASDLDFKQTLENVTQIATRLTEARFGAFFYNVEDENGESYRLATIDGADKDAFEGMPMPRNTALFAPTFRGDQAIRLDDVTRDPRYGKSPPHFGIPQGHPPVRSYMAVPVSSSERVIGGLFFGHPEPGRFTARHERLATGIASWATIALDNARLYAEARQVQDQLRQSNRAKDEFLGLVSHELRTPTTTIYGGLRLLEARRDRLSPEALEELISSMAEESARLVRLIENLLAIARSEMGKEPDLQGADVNDLVQSVVNRFRARNRSRTIETELGEGLPEVNIEPTHFEQTLQNLLSNADKYSPIREPVVVRTFRRGDEVMISVADRGPGVPPEEVELIFESFYRSDGSSGKVQGQGLGLAVCRRLTEAQLGRIWAENRPGGGLRVTFAFPVPEPSTGSRASLERGELEIEAQGEGARA